jgi:hypothetical protein
MYLVGNDVDTLYEEIEYLVGHLVGNDVDTLHGERIHLVGFSFIRVIDLVLVYKHSTNQIAFSQILICHTGGKTRSVANEE